MGCRTGYTIFAAHESQKGLLRAYKKLVPVRNFPAGTTPLEDNGLNYHLGAIAEEA